MWLLGIILCGRIWENPPCKEFFDILVNYIISDKLYRTLELTQLQNRDQLCILLLTLECSVCDHATCYTIGNSNKKKQSKYVATYIFNVSVYFTTTESKFNLDRAVWNELSSIMRTSCTSSMPIKLKGWVYTNQQV